MGKGQIIGLIVAIIAIIGVIGFILLSRSPQNVSTTTPTTSTLLDERNETNTPSTLRELMSVTANQSCSYSDEFGASGTFYVANGKMRGDFGVETNSEIQNMHTIYDGSNIYMWYDTEPVQGYKITMTDIEKFTDTGEDLPAQAGGQKSVDLDQKVNLNCSNWVVDNSKFSLPNVEFQDFGALLPSSIPSDAEMTCESCDNLPEAAQASCRQALGC